MPYILPVSATINGSFPLHGWDGWLHGLKSEVETFARLGETGSGAQILRTRAPESSITATRVCSSLREARDAAETAEDWQGQVLMVTDPWGRAFLRVRFHEVTPVVKACSGTGPDNQRAAAKVVLTLRLEALPDA